MPIAWVCTCQYASELCVAHAHGMSAHMSRTSVCTCTQDAALEGAAQKKEIKMLRDELHEAKERLDQLQREVDDAGEVIDNLNAVPKTKCMQGRQTISGGAGTHSTGGHMYVHMSACRQ